MDLRKVFDQTVRDIKREVNKKVLKIPEIEQKVLDATSNEPWGPHGALMADIAQATRNFNEFQMVMAILWKRLTDTGRNWRHVYKSLTVFEFLVAHGADRVTEELKEHTFQLQGLVDFQYVEPNGKDQGVNVRKKAQSLVALVNDKEKIREVRQKAAANRDKYQGFSSSGGIYKSTPHSNTGRGYSDWDDDRHSANGRYGGRDDRFGGSPEEDRYGRVGDRYTKENDRYRANLYHSDHDRDCNESRHGTRGFDYVDDKKEDDEGDLRNGVSRMPGGNRTAAYEEPYQKKYERDAKSFGAASTLNPPTTSQSKPLTTVQEDDDFNPRAPGSTVPAVPSSTEVDFFSQTDFLSTTTSSSAVEDLFTGQSFQSASSNSKNNVLNPRSDLFAPASDPFAPPASFATTNDFGAFSSAPTSDFSTLTSAPSSDFSAFTSAPSSDFSAFTSAPSSDFTAFTSAPSSDFTPFTPAPPSNTHIHGGGDLFGTDPFSSFGNLQSESKPLGNSGTFDAFESVPSHVAAPSFAAFEAVGNTSTVSQPPPSSFSATAASAKFEPKSSLWADSLSSGLIDLNIGAPKSNALAELGIQLDSSLGSDWTKEEKPQHSIKGKAMGAGTGLGRAGASGLPPPPPPNMGQGGGYGIGTAAPTSTGAGYFNMTPGAFMDTHQNGMNSMGVLPNQQQQFGGFR